MSDDAYDLIAEMSRSRVDMAELLRLTGVGRTGYYRWRSGELPVPAYVRTILRQRRQILDLQAQMRAVSAS